MNPYRLKDVFNYLTSNNQLLKRKLKLGTDEIPIPPKRSDVTTIEAINRFNKANPRVDTTNLKPLSVKQSNVKQSNVDQADEGVIQGAFDTATREAQSEGFPAPKYEAFKKRYLRKNMKADGGRIGYKYGTVPGEGNSKINYDPETDTYRKRVQETIDGKKTNKYIYSKPGDSLEDFKQIKPVRSTGADDATVKARQYVDNWTKDWFDNNLKKYSINNFNAMMDDLSSAWQLQLESGNAPKASGKFNLSTPELNLPNITSGKDSTIKKGSIKPFSYNDVRFYSNLESSAEQKSKTLSQYRKVFYKDQINNNPKLQKDLTKFFDFMSSNKQGQYRKLDGKTIKDFMNTEVSDEVKFLLDPEISGLDKASKKEVFNSYSDFADNYNKYTEDKVRLKAVQAETEAIAKVGKKTADQYKKVKADIAKQNDVLAKMSVKDIANNKELLNSVRLSINPQTGEVSYTNYTVNNPKGKTMSKSVKLTDLELAKYIKQKASDGKFYVTEHIGKKSFNKANLAFPNNIQSANYMSNSQLENARRFLIIPENRNTAAAQNLDKTLENLKLTIRGPEYGGKPIGNKMNIVFDSKTGLSNIVEDQKILGKFTKPISNQAGFVSKELLEDVARKIGSVGRKGTGVASGGLTEALFYYLDKNNMISKGMSETEAAEQAKENVTFGLYKNKAYMDSLKEIAEDMDINPSTFDSAYNLNILSKQYEQNTKNVQDQVDAALQNNDQKTANDLIKNYRVYKDRTQKEYERLENDITGRISGGSPQIMSDAKNFITEKQFAEPFYDMQNAAIEKLKREKLRAFDTQKLQSDTAAGSTGSALLSNVFNTQSLPRAGKFLFDLSNPFSVLPNYKNYLSDAEKENQMLRSLEPSDLNLVNLARGFTRDNIRSANIESPILASDIENIKYQNPGVFFSKGGIASLTDTIPPKSGPTPHGLPSLMKRGIKIKE